MSTKNMGSTPQRQFENRTNWNYTNMSKLSGDIKYIYTTSSGHEFIPVVTDDIKNICQQSL